MDYATASFTITGIAPLIMHNGQLANPLNEHSRAMKEITKKRNKTDTDYEECARLEHRGGLYLDADGKPCIPSANIESMIVAGAKKSKEGPSAKAGMIVAGESWPLVFDGPKTADGLWKDKRFVQTVGAKIGKVTVMRTRPIFPAWSLSFDVMFLEDIINRKDLKSWVEVAGKLVGLGDWKPRYGRFVIED